VRHMILDRGQCIDRQSEARAPWNTIDQKWSFRERGGLLFHKAGSATYAGHIRQLRRKRTCSASSSRAEHYRQRKRQSALACPHQRVPRAARWSYVPVWPPLPRGLRLAGSSVSPICVSECYSIHNLARCRTQSWRRRIRCVQPVPALPIVLASLIAAFFSWNAAVSSGSKNVSIVSRWGSCGHLISKTHRRISRPYWIRQPSGRKQIAKQLSEQVVHWTV
jgi:hypothetical protein